MTLGRYGASQPLRPHAEEAAVGGRLEAWVASPERANTASFDYNNVMVSIAHPGHLLKRELAARRLSANRLSLDIGVPSGRITDIRNGRRSISADTAVRLGRYFGDSALFWLGLQEMVEHRGGRTREGERDRKARAARGCGVMNTLVSRKIVMRYAIVIEKAEGNYSAYVPDLPGCVATGATVQEVEQDMRAAIRFHVDGMTE